MPSMSNLVISTIVFFIVAWFANRYLNEQGIPKGMTRSVMVFFVASMVSWGAGDAVDWIQVKIEAGSARNRCCNRSQTCGAPILPA